MKTIFISGATSGFGRATAELLAKQGHKLVLIGRRQERLDELKDSLGAQVHVASVDVRNKQQVADFFRDLPQEFDDIDVAVNCAGLARGLDPAQESDLTDWDEMVDTNIKGLLYVTRAVLDIMKRRGNGLIINIGSVAGHLPYKGGNVYGATKAFVRQFSNNLRTDLFGTDIKITNVEPGMAQTEFASVRFKGDQTKATATYADYRPLHAEDVAKTIAWVIDQPVRVNIDNIEIWPLDQTYGGSAINRPRP